MKVLLTSLVLQIALPGYLARPDGTALDSGLINSTPIDDTILTSPPSFSGPGRDLLPVEKDRNPVNYVQNTAGKNVFMVLDNRKCLGLVGTTYEDAKAVDSDVLEENCSNSSDSDLEILQEDGSTRKVRGFFRNGLRKATSTELGQMPAVSLARRATKSRGDYAALKRRAPRQFANQAALRRRDTEAQIAVNQQQQQSTTADQGSPNTTSSPSSSSDEGTA
ncbi:hypothetical protein H4R34_004152 [Dimargaris verticillata]|uniref:Uncharacterized protein n=1 Tax=Dimargaris verticillata TaxID=2761393 RepID=A0A9W8B651_9FUNG|nr:hypothetical protein H4R34_004152 [Dimargaris verticillata]